MDVLKFSQKFKRNSRYFHVWNGENSWKFAIQIWNKIRNCYEKENAFDLSKQSADLFPHWLWSSKRHSYDLLHFPARIFCKQKQTFFCVSSIDLGILRYVLILLFIVSVACYMVGLCIQLEELEYWPTTISTYLSIMDTDSDMGVNWFLNAYAMWIVKSQITTVCVCLLIILSVVINLKCIRMR